MAPSGWERAKARVFRFVQVGPAAGFMTFWTVACSVWTGMWLLLDVVLVPHGIGLPTPYLVAIGVATGMCPMAFMLCGRALMLVELGHADADHRHSPHIASTDRD